MKKIRLPLGRSSYAITVGSRLLSRAGSLIAPLHAGTDAFLVTNTRLNRLYGRRLARSLAAKDIACHMIIVPDTERSKSLRVAERVLCAMAREGAMRSAFVIGLGGGVIGDLAGFVAALYKRGVPVIQVPTTLLAQVDSAIGGKTAVDLPAAKNLVGAFHQPRIVISDIDVLATLPPRQVRTGLAEIIKYGVIDDPALFSYLEKNYGKVLNGDRAALEHVIARSSAIKASYVARDEFDTKGIRAALNFGHTIGHAIEAAAGYSSRYTHGEAIAIGMAAAADIAVHLGLLTQDAADRIQRLITRCGLPTHARGLSVKAVIAAHLHDKKFVNKKNRFILPTAIGSVRLSEGVPERVVRQVIADRLRTERAPARA